MMMTLILLMMSLGSLEMLNTGERGVGRAFLLQHNLLVILLMKQVSIRRRMMISVMMIIFETVLESNFS